jgi:type I restriction enzyme S subunit
LKKSKWRKIKMSNQASLGDISDNSESGCEKISENELERRTVCGVPPKDWKSERLENITEIVSGKSLPTEEQGESRGFPVYKVEDMNKSENFKYMNSADNYLTKEKIDELNHSLHPENTVILPKVGAALLTNKRRILTEKASFDNNTMGWIPGDALNPEFFYYTTCRVDMESYAQKGAVPSISKSIAGNLKFPVPEKDEQRRIASVLYNMDQAISKTEEIIEQTQRVKKGLMQDLFTEGYYSYEEFQETPIGKVPKDWSVENLENHIELISGAHVKSDLVSDDSSLTPYITGPEDFEDEGFSVTKFTDEPTKFCEPGDVLVTVKGSGCGKSTLADQRACISRQLKALRVEDSLNEKFLFNFIRHKQNLLETLAEGSAIPGLSNSHMNKMKVPVPEPEEQEKIADAFENLDEKIKNQKMEREQLQLLKKGLMQDLLSGEVRIDQNMEVLDEVVEVESSE